MRGSTSRMHHPFRNPFMVEMGDLLPQMVILQQCRPARPGAQRMVGIRQP